MARLNAFKNIGQALGKPGSGHAVARPEAASAPLLAAGALLLRTETELLLKSRYVVPERLLASGFVFEYPRWEDAAADLCRRWREGRARPAA